MQKNIHINRIILEIKGLLGKKKYTYEQFAVMIGKSKQTLINYFNERSKIDIQTLYDIAKALDVPVTYFFEDKPAASYLTNTEQSIIAKEDQTTYAGKCKVYEMEVEGLKAIIAEKEKQIEDKERMIQLLLKSSK